ncbi:SDR family NAD(P)-dependent oxidoreductase [Cohnella thailandensis]|uniref:SDR family oxidoreductase n=1 Tax=Cohnella thailandensis TaxID=557557 RepID=A0A841SVE5_9BACL|nr:SDR family NAD(P)-dependent oxidoreductase [Cohnella thailandensis]MBB6634959.1 SDR family oxidoreductase [Cohnella thailandensis]MBP1975819.1 NAD(P)-dependent dehydrogenase (short-subunit alcohol dehydrogenase family) [Cohnella thailandensis]
MRLSGKIAFISGAGSGIGRASALLFAQEGATVVIGDRNVEAGEAVAEEIRQAGGEAFFVELDVGEEKSVKAAVGTVLERFGRIDVLFNNAGISGVGAIHETEPDEWDKVVRVNLRGVYLLNRYAIPSMMERRSGSIINMSSCAAEMGLSRRAVYSATKGAVLALTKAMQVDYASYGIRVNALLPGTILTPFVEGYLKSSYSDPEEAFGSIKKRQLSEELGRPEDVAKAALFLASDESSFVMGSPLYVDGGVVFGKNA